MVHWKMIIIVVILQSMCLPFIWIKYGWKGAILDGVIPNEYEAARELMLKKAEKMGLKPIK